MFSYTRATPGQDDLLVGEVKNAAKSVHAEWNEVIDQDEIEQRIWDNLLTSPGTLDRYYEFDKPQRMKMLRNIGHRESSKERTEYEHFSGQYHYTTREVRKFLKNGVLTEGRERTRTERLDVDEGMALLGRDNERYANIVWDHYAEGIPQDAGPSGGRLLTSAVDELTRCMNRVHKNRHSTPLYRHTPETTVTVTKDGKTETRPLTEAEWDLTAKTYARELDAYYATNPQGGIGTREITRNSDSIASNDKQYERGWFIPASKTARTADEIAYEEWALNNG